MKKMLLGASLLLVVVLSGCGNRDMGFGNYDYNFVTGHGIVEFHNEPISSWKDFEDGEQIEFTLKSNRNNILARGELLCAFERTK